jgi:hypothetical protein
MMTDRYSPRVCAAVLVAATIVSWVFVALEVRGLLIVLRWVLPT